MLVIDIAKISSKAYLGTSNSKNIPLLLLTVNSQRPQAE